MGLTLSVDGQLIEPEEHSSGEVRFRLRLPAREIRLLSGAARPLDIGHNCDRRRLGVRVRGVRFEQNGAAHEAPIESGAFVDGFHHFEASGFRWTNGNALLPSVHIPDWEGDVDLHLSLQEWFASALPATGRSPAAVMDAFEALGLNCELAFAQRHFNATVPAGLLSWSGLGYDQLIAGLTSRFAGVGDLESTRIARGTTEYSLYTPYFRAHTGHYQEVDDEAVEGIRRAGAARLRLLLRKLIKDITEARRIFVFKPRDVDITQDQIHDLHAALRGIGPAPLLSVSLATPGEEGGSVERLDDGLYRGRLSKFVLGDGPYDEWRTLCDRTLTLHREIPTSVSLP